MSVKNCNQCEKVFASSSSLSHHKRSHNKSDIVTCELCGKQFRTNILKRHKESLGGSTGFDRWGTGRSRRWCCGGDAPIFG